MYLRSHVISVDGLTFTDGISEYCLLIWIASTRRLVNILLLMYEILAPCTIALRRNQLNLHHGKHDLNDKANSFIYSPLGLVKNGDVHQTCHSKWLATPPYLDWLIRVTIYRFWHLHVAVPIIYFTFPSNDLYSLEVTIIRKMNTTLFSAQLYIYFR